MSIKHDIAETAARLLAEQGVLDYAWARHKAAQRHGSSRERDLPDLGEVEAAFVRYQQLFRPQDGEALLAQQQSAVVLMERFSRYSPRLAGPLARGVSAPQAQPLIYLFSESAKDVVFLLMEEKLSWESDDAMLGDGSSVPQFHVDFEGKLFRLQVLPPNALKHPPLDEVTGARDAGLSLEALKSQLAAMPA